MEPSLIGWEWSNHAGYGGGTGAAAAMEPSLIGWEWPAVRVCGPEGARRRNGAQPYRLGMARGHTVFPSKDRSRNGAQPYRLGMARQIRWRQECCWAAMEPSLIGWEWRLEGMVRSRYRWGRNGAQPYRLGMVRRDMRRGGVFHVAAMEPSLIGWEWANTNRCPAGSDMPQWSPALSAGNGPDHCTQRPPRATEPQWSPALSAGNGCAATPNPRSGLSGPQWSPALSAGNGARR